MKTAIGSRTRVEGAGGQLMLGQGTNAIGPVIRGRTVLLLPPEPDGGETGGVREPRRPRPNPSATCAELSQPEHS